MDERAIKQKFAELVRELSAQGADEIDIGLAATDLGAMLSGGLLRRRLKPGVSKEQARDAYLEGVGKAWDTGWRAVNGTGRG